MVWASVWSDVLASSAADMNENPLPARFVGVRQRDVKRPARAARPGAAHLGGKFAGTTRPTVCAA
jgi:hypothetical protein